MVAATMLLEEANPHSWEAKATAALIGVATHVFVFRHGEWDTQAANIAALIPVTWAAIATLIVYQENAGEIPTTDISAWIPPAKTAGLLLGSAVTGLFTSMLIYRAFFHRLNRFPGPFPARLSNFWITGKALKKLHLHEEIQELHRQYGDIVRIGPSELSINDPKAVNAIHSNSSKCIKGPWYNVLKPTDSLQMVREQKAHAIRRKAWDKAFSAKSLRDYEPRVAQHTTQLLDRLQGFAARKETVNVSQWFNYYSFDVMGALAYNESFKMLEGGQVHYFMSTLHGSMKAIGQFSHLMWLFPIFKATPILNSVNKSFEKFLQKQTEQRIAMTPELPDVFSWVLDDYNQKPNKTYQDKLNLYGDAYLITVAGSDTTAATLICLVFELSQSPKASQTLRDEIDAYYKEHDESDYANLHKCAYLQACVNETLRLHPPVPSGVQRFTPPEGINVGSTHIPGNTIVQIPSHTMFRDPRLFPQPDDFIPERWTTRKELVKDPLVFTPFSVGPYNCVGKALAYMEIRYVMSQIMKRWTFGLAKEQAPENFVNGKADTFTLFPPELKVDFRERV